MFNSNLYINLQYTVHFLGSNTLSVTRHRFVICVYLFCFGYHAPELGSVINVTSIILIARIREAYGEARRCQVIWDLFGVIFVACRSVTYQMSVGLSHSTS